jgi:hypothetical protein
MSSSHDGGCSCCSTMLFGGLQQSLDEVAFERGLWGYILREPSGRQVEAFIATHGEMCVDLPDKAGYTPLLYAARHGNAEVCEVLLSHGASISSVTPGFGQTALHRACMAGHAEVVRVLLRHGAERFTADINGKLPVDLVAPGSAAASEIRSLLAGSAAR